MYRKPAHTNLFLKSGSHYQPSSIDSVPATLTHMARALCERKIFHDELDFINTGTATLTLGHTHTVCTGSFRVVKRVGRGINHSPHLAPRLKKE